MAATRENTKRLPGVRLHERVMPVSSLSEAADSRALLLAVPAQTVRSVCEALALTMKDGLPAIITAKGIERDRKSVV